MASQLPPRDDRGRFTKGGGVLAAVALAAVLASGAGTGAGAVGSAGAGGSGSSAGSGGARAQGGNSSSVRGKARDRSTARTTARLVREGLQVEQRATSSDGGCVAPSYGQVQDFFRQHPCTALFRALLEVHDNRRNVVLVAVAWVDMPDADQARELQQLMDRSGTGNVTELSREEGRQRFSGDYYRSARDGTTVVNVQAEPVGTARAAVALAKLAASSTV